MAEHRLRILHVSDLHERAIAEWMPEERKRRVRLGMAARHRVLSDDFFDKLGEIRSAVPVDLVCFTGDAADWGVPEEFARVTPRLDAILAALGLSRDRLFLIPGNHDVDRLHAVPAWKGMRELLRGEDLAHLSEWMAGLKPPRGTEPGWRDDIILRTTAFWRWVREDLQRLVLDPASSDHGSLGYRVTLDDLGLPFPVHLIGLDSGWLCGDDNDAHRICLTTGQIDCHTTHEGNRLPGFRLAMMHHPLSDLADETRSFQLLANTVDLLLHGHQHDPILQLRKDPDRDLLVLAAGSLFEGDGQDRWLNSFHVIDVLLNDEGRPLKYEIEFWGWSERGHWYRTGAIYREAPGGRLTWWTALGRDRRTPRNNYVPPRTFVGREDERAQLTAALLHEPVSPRPVVVCNVQGMAGVGKTRLVEQFYAEHVAEFQGGYLPLLLGTESTPTVEGLLGNLADDLKLQTRDAEEIAAVLRQARPLLHLENVDSRELAVVAVAMVDRLPGASLVITGRFAGFESDARWQTIQLLPFEVQVGMQQLAAELSSDAVARVSEAQRQVLVGVLGGLPLAIHLAAGYLNAGFEVPSFLEYLRSTGLSVEPFAPNDREYRHRAEQALKATLDLSLGLFAQALGPDDPGARVALCALGIAPRSGFGTELAAAIAEREPMATTRLLVEATAFSLVDRTPSTMGPANRWRVHLLMAEHLHAQLDEPGRAAATARRDAWFLACITADDAQGDSSPGAAAENEIAGLSEWLEELATGAEPALAAHVVHVGSHFAYNHGPFHRWLSVVARARKADLPNEELLQLLYSQSTLAHRAGELDLALKVSREMEEVGRRLGRDRDVALAASLRADIFQAQGNLVEALRVRRNEELPVFERLDDMRSRAVTMMKVADILRSRGELDEALRTITEEALPVLGGIDDLRSLAIGLGQVADILSERGDLIEALRIRREEELPVFERLGDVRSQAVTKGKIAAIVLQQGEPDEALRILHDEVIPVFRRMGDVPALAVAIGKVADAHQVRGDLDESLRIRLEEQLPANVRIGSARGVAVTKQSIAAIRFRKGEFEEALKLVQDDVLPEFERIGDARSRATAVGLVADILQARGELDEALRIRREEELPIYEQGGDYHSLAVRRASLAANLLQRHSPGDRDEAHELLKLALEAAQSLRIPQEEQIAALLAQVVAQDKGAL